jgi:hypothetical protein
MFIEISIISLKITGLSRVKARFQVISLLTSTGFTTRESELITQHPIRRKIAERIMIFKYFAGIVGTASLFNVYTSWIAKKIDMSDVIIWIVLLALILLVIKSKWIINRLDYFVEKQLIRDSRRNKKRFKHGTLAGSGEFGIIDVVMGEGSYLIGTKLKEAGLKSSYIQILQIDKGDKHYPFPKADYIFEAGDKLTMYGNLNSIKMLIMDDLQNEKNSNVYHV